MGSEFWYPVLESNNSDQYQILQELGDHGILVKFQRDFDQNSFQDLDDPEIHQGISMVTEFRKDFDQNSF